MSDIARWAAFDGGIAPHPYGKWILFDDHQAEVERLKNALDHLTSERNEAQAEVERLKNTLYPWDTYYRLKNANEHLKEDVAKLTVDRDEARAEVERLKELLDQESKSLPKLIDSMTSQLRATADRVTAERDAAQAEVERLRASGQAILDSSRPTDEDIWREGFMRCLNDVAAEDWRAQADLVLTTYRERWPR